MKNGWQLAVVDYDRAIAKFPKYAKYRAHLEKIKQSDNPNVFKQGDVIYIISVFRVPVDREIDPRYAEFCDGSFASFGLPVADIYYPKGKAYSRLPLMELHPVLSEKDALEIELQMGISLKEYM